MKQEKYMPSEKETKLVKIIYDLYGTYNLNIEEIDSLFYRDNTIYDVIVKRINSVYEDIKFYDKKYKIPFNTDEIKNNLLDENNIQENIINPLLKTKTKISKFDKIIQERIYEKINNTIKLIKNKDKILNEYGNFEEFEYLKNVDNEKSFLNTSINNKNISNTNTPIINEVIFKKCQEVIAKKSLDKFDDKDMDIKI